MLEFAPEMGCSSRLHLLQVHLMMHLAGLGYSVEINLLVEAKLKVPHLIECFVVV